MSISKKSSRLALEFSFKQQADHDHRAARAHHRADATHYPIGEVLFHGRSRQQTDAVQVQAACLDEHSEHGGLVERWLSDEAMSAVVDGDMRYTFNHDLLFGAIDIADTLRDVSPDDAPQAPVPVLQSATQRAYEQIFALLDEQGFTHLLRIWNYLPQINAQTFGMERYRQFNMGRQEAFIKAGRAAFKGAPAACALGSQGEHLVIYFIASRNEPIAIENPRQVSAYHYPTQYGPKAPTFSRASLTHTGSQSIFFISGTASIVGHESVHVGDVTAQTQETFNNLDAILANSNALHQPTEHTPWSYADLYLKVYVRHAHELPLIKQVITQRAASAKFVAYLLADICRDDLLVEIEATAIRETV
jgi:chorismate lyase / 3-hydroxybenzoate synthase